MRGVGLRVVLTSAYAWPEVRRGGERYLHQLASGLAAAGHDVRILAAAPSAGAGEVLGVPVRRLRRREVRRRRYGDLAGEVGFGVQSLVQLGVRRLDVWHAMTTADAAAAVAVGAVRPGVRTVFTDHGFPAAASRAKRADARLHGVVARRIDAYVCVSEAAGAFLRSDFGRDPTVVPPGVDVDAFRPADRRHPAPALLYSGSVDEPRKNVRLLLAAAGRLRADLPDLELWLLGPGDLEPLLAAEPAGAAAVTRTGSVGDATLADAYARAWVTVLPSQAESFGMTVIESFAAGTPAVVLAESGGPAEIVVAGTGVCCPTADAQALAASCREALDLARDPATRDLCRTRAEQFDWRRVVVPRLEAVYAGG